ncbi:hypothetical protein IQ265_13780 [Nodosilinea sp. LEGE 06152]|uniref:hypothetical protein n=1 Tax=Nodosilinea sp. LEGE 06152 TaxID=2777966 RepID=UPI00188055C3|nr:hypothetical protein [Nodosilinea sp. LEGE 06152]MBE9157886.1 hypothetical protein [Nodosilinea sp. LEGE 06152]
MISQTLALALALALALLLALPVLASKRDRFPGRRQPGTAPGAIADVLAFDLDGDATIMGMEEI